MRVLLAVDDSPYSQAAARALVAQARPGDTEVLVLHVIEPLPAAYGSVEGGYIVNWQAITQEQRQRAAELVEQYARTLRDAGFRATTAVETGGAKSVIIDRAATWPADLILLGSHGRRGIDCFLLGSVSEAVARHAPCSVQIVRVPRG